MPDDIDDDIEDFRRYGLITKIFHHGIDDAKFDSVSTEQGDIGSANIGDAQIDSAQSRVPIQPISYPDYPSTYGFSSSNGRTNGTVHLRFDDGYNNDYTDVYPELQSRRLTGGFAIPPERMGDNGHMTWDQVHELKQNGMHLLAHLPVSRYDGDLVDEPLDQWHEDIIGDKGLKAFRDQSLFVQGWIKPGTASLDNPHQFLSTAHGNILRRAHRLINLGGRQEPDVYPSKPPIGGPIFPQEINPSSLTEAQERLDEAASSGNACMFVFHSNNLLNGNDWISWTDFLTLLDDIETKVNNDEIDCVSAAHLAYANSNVRDYNLLSNGSFEAGSLGKTWYQDFGSPTVIDQSSVGFNAADGTYLVDATATGNQLIQARLPPRGQDQWIVEAKFRAASGSATGRVQVSPNNADGSYNKYSCDDTGWTTAREIVGADADTRHISMWFGHLDGDGGVYVDDVNVYPI